MRRMKRRPPLHGTGDHRQAPGRARRRPSCPPRALRAWRAHAPDAAARRVDQPARHLGRDGNTHRPQRADVCPGRTAARGGLASRGQHRAGSREDRTARPRWPGRTATDGPRGTTAARRGRERRRASLNSVTTYLRLVDTHRLKFRDGLCRRSADSGRADHVVSVAAQTASSGSQAAGVRTRNGNSPRRCSRREKDSSPVAMNLVGGCPARLRS